MTYLGTTTWKNRNYDRLQRLKDEAVNIGISTPSIIEVGPGGTVNFLSKYSPSGRKADWNYRQRVQRGIVQLSEGILRKTGLFLLETSEPEEVVRVFKDLNPTSVYVVDIESKVLEAVQRIVEINGLPHNFQYHQIDVLKEKIKYQAEIVIAYNVIQRTSDWYVSLNNIANFVKKGGLLSVCIGCQERTQILDDNLHSFDRVDEGLYLRRSN